MEWPLLEKNSVTHNCSSLHSVWGDHLSGRDLALQGHKEQQRRQTLRTSCQFIQKNFEKRKGTHINEKHKHVWKTKATDLGLRRL